jgi:RNA polymerase sigma-70 factor (ECF subfamily)
VQDCYLRALKHFDTFRGGAMRPWLFAILRNVCKATYAQQRFVDRTPPRTRRRYGAKHRRRGVALRRRDDQSIRDMVGALPDVFREAIVCARSTACRIAKSPSSWVRRLAP